MELHRCRFVPYNPSAINALEFSHPPSSKAAGQGAQTLRLAVGRANGDIEIWNPLRGAWFQETIIRGGKGRSIEGLAWTLDPSEDAPDGSGMRLPGHLRLFSIGYTNTVTEWDLEKGKPARHSSGSYGEIWCLTAQPRWTAEKSSTTGPADGEYTGQHLAIGCADGSIVILSTADNDLRFVRRLNASVTKNVRVLSITFQNRHVLAAGYADSSIRLFDIRNGRLLRTVSLGRGPVGGPKDILVWSVKSLPDGTLVSGDSTGEIRFWDAKNYSLVQRLRGHQADVLDVAVSIDGETVVSGGADRRTVLYRLKPGKKNDKSRRWAEVMHRRYHTHDVKKFAVYESKDMSIAVSGGPDASLVVLPLRESGKEHHRTLSSLPQICQLASGSSSRFMMSFWEREVRIWKIAPESGADAESQRNQFVGRVLIPGDENITSATLSTDGSLLVLSTMTTIRMFSLSESEGHDEENILQIKDLKLPRQVTDDGARTIFLSPDSRWLSIIRPGNEIYLAKLSVIDTNSDKDVQVHSKLVRLQRSSGRTQSLRGINQGTLGEYDRTIRAVTFSSDSKLFATGDLAGYVDSWILEHVNEQSNKKTPNGTTLSDDDSSDDEDNVEEIIDDQYWRPLSLMPCLHSGIIFMSFRPSIKTSKSIEDRLLVLTSKHQLTEYEVLAGKFSEWSQRNPKSCLPEEFIGLKDRATGGVCGLFQRSPKLLLYGPSWMWMFDLTHDFPSQSADVDDIRKGFGTSAVDLVQTAKRKRETNDNEDLEDAHGDENEHLRRRYNSGAGDLIPKSQATVSMGTKMRKIMGGDNKNNNKQSQWIDVEKHRIHHNGDNEDDEDSHPFFANGEPDFARLRRQIANNHTINEEEPQAGTPQKPTDGASFAVVINQKTPQKSTPQQPAHEPETKTATIFWHSYKFRDILGMLPLGHSSQSTMTAKDAVELAVVERPMWDMELGERYVKDYE
ncbi:small nucleolar ribonucleoprotein complex subunit, putative [Talaromyces stipitatus ATCC 10500]|uniref:Small nucleolar ribonucleoprotein complex subunit, putative n=1 Tax=Talaromyces stipitatus (strain ATCC 10500 / CBS 375.48 / QM 6759 / NRRL 1006) TaxID=441959 RepID=B8MJI5_TALSN|nr:small nucleolar ribonucleoprotein complex subunit, putative [Talaromyces stipitatus ATCC 10500]EED15185.1 small nucleolar ribonucleoprotein complex subunit, putative [Talaromyces stipitatus ATCC 10500]